MCFFFPGWTIVVYTAYIYCMITYLYTNYNKVSKLPALRPIVWYFGIEEIDPSQIEMFDRCGVYLTSGAG